jgi:hypothetical protein
MKDANGNRVGDYAIDDYRVWHAATSTSYQWSSQGGALATTEIYFESGNCTGQKMRMYRIPGMNVSAGAWQAGTAYDVSGVVHRTSVNTTLRTAQSVLSTSGTCSAVTSGAWVYNLAMEYFDLNTVTPALPVQLSVPVTYAWE